ncbi:large-conductance mechanosensitive channel [Candidatus Campbellbacteria bacterium RIFCSPLOWO2_01_FULL_34_15]|uniref:Large-conductance mechanosensitive channel n=2 Tax=Candidatus Campbelliibacteriota TaxID=1752727 RepID=A0A1F5ELL5_9BACT|nr:MAG: large-conductance mechanosensitive channel [Candidatus Campbellbacteria bacterium RIFCSPHIGHO2_01_FULL_34_10]OGD68319.1 MAG: large-conductance mechanosensitive channel [Candidatus Campbellbacteria bacterium RIFCSPLOWO2_01_FULL_34_15]
MEIIKEFKEFAIKGNVVDMAVGIVIGTAFGKIVSSFVADIIMPPIGVITGGVDFSNLVFTLKSATETTETITLNYGIFLNTVIDFVIIAFAIFFVIKQINRFKRKEETKQEEKPEEPAEEIVLLREIRDSLKK